MFYTALKTKEEWLPGLADSVRSHMAFATRVRDKIVFFNDPATGGGHTLALRLDPSDTLYNLQEDIGRILEPFVDWSCLESNSGFNQEPFKSSYDRFGFAFLGSHWIPHFTIASLRIPQHDTFIKTFEKVDVDYSMDIDKVSLWQVFGDQHKCLETFHLRSE